MMNMTPLHKPVAGVLSAIFLTGALSGCGESDFDKARKPELINRAVATSLLKCDLQDKKPQEISYESRLRIALTPTDSRALDRLEEKEITICLDQRLNNMKTSFLSTKIEGLYYPDSRIVSLWDNGHNPESLSWYHKKINSWSGPSLEKLSEDVLNTPQKTYCWRALLILMAAAKPAPTPNGNGEMTQILKNS